jgi:hypothetical protein
MNLMIEENMVDDETREFRLNGSEVITLNHDEHGWAGMTLVRTVLENVKKILEAK